MDRGLSFQMVSNKGIDVSSGPIRGFLVRLSFYGCTVFFFLL